MKRYNKPKCMKDICELRKSKRKVVNKKPDEPKYESEEACKELFNDISTVGNALASNIACIKSELCYLKSIVNTPKTFMFSDPNENGNLTITNQTYIFITGVGGGGAGGVGFVDDFYYYYGGGGGSGACLIKKPVLVVPGTLITVHVGKGGIQTINGPIDGENTTITITYPDGMVTIITISGGSNGHPNYIEMNNGLMPLSLNPLSINPVAAMSSPGDIGLVAGGTGGANDVPSLRGNDGQDGIVILPSQSQGDIGHGGASFFDGGGNNGSTANNVIGNNGTYGSGGGGSIAKTSINWINQVSGNGGNGIVIIDTL